MQSAAPTTARWSGSRSATASPNWRRAGTVAQFEGRSPISLSLLTPDLIGDHTLGIRKPPYFVIASGAKQSRVRANRSGLLRSARNDGMTDAKAISEDRKSVVWGKRVSVRVDIGGRRIINKKTGK